MFEVLQYFRLNTTSSLLDRKPIVFDRGTLYELCQAEDPTRRVCKDIRFAERTCNSFPITIVKLVRLDLELAGKMLQDPDFENLKFVYLVRDPRSVFASRWKKKFCRIECSRIDLFCSDINKDFATLSKLKAAYPGKIHFLRFEDLAMDPQNVTKKLFLDLGIEHNEFTMKYLEDHTNSTRNCNWCTYKVTKDRVIPWATDENLPWESVQQVQTTCEKSMRNYGYKVVNKTGKVSVKDAIKF